MVSIVSRFPRKPNAAYPVKIAGALSQKVEATPTEVGEQWVTWQVRGDAATVRGMLGDNKK